MWNLFFLLFLIFAVSDGKYNEINKPPNQFSDAYAVKGSLIIPYAEIKEPFAAWFDLQKGSSRIDYYGGMVKTYQLAAQSKVVKIIPVTTEEYTNKETCLQISGGSVSPQSVLPDISNFEYAGEDVINGLPCYKWTMTNSFGDKVNKYTMWTRVKKAWRHLSNMAVPVRYEMKGFNSLLGSHYDHYYLDYDWYSPESPSDSVFSVQNYTCQAFPQTGLEHIYTFNPMKEFIHHFDEHVYSAFEDFKKTHNKVYEDRREHTKRLELFRQNMRFIHSHNRAGRSYTLGVNHLADKSDLEIKVMRGYRHSSDSGHDAKPFPYTREKVREILGNLPDSLDWRLNGAVTPVKDQSVCGSCWSFGSTGAIEGAYFLKHGKLFRASQQALVDCSWGFNNNGCDGGECPWSFRWAEIHGIPTEDAYGPYLGQDGYCHLNKSMEMLRIKEHVGVKQGDIEGLKVALAVHGPVSVAIDASHKTFSFYSNGVYYEPDCQNSPFGLDHAVLAVGYGKMGDKDYWLVKNSWSTYWGNDGYILMAQKDNNCGVATAAFYVNA